MASDPEQMAAFHFLGGLWTSAIVAHLGKIIAANALGHAYWRAAERKLERGAPPHHHWLLCPLLHIGSVALGATASLLSPLLLPLQLAGLRTFDHFSEAGHALPPAPASPLPPCSSRLSTRPPLPYARASSYSKLRVFFHRQKTACSTARQFTSKCSLIRSCYQQAGSHRGR